MQRMPQVVVGLVAAVGMTMIWDTAHAAEGRVGYSWRLSSADGRIDKEQPEVFETVPLGLFETVPPVTKSDFVDLLLPAQTSADVSLSGRVDLLARSLGVSVSARAKVNPYDPESETLDPILVSAEAAVESSFVDRVVVLDPTLSPGAPITFKVQPLQTFGRMDVNPDNPNGAGGSAIFLINFALASVLGGPAAPVVLNYEKIIVSGTAAESRWNTRGLTSLSNLAGGPITVPNGSIWDVSFSIRASVQALPGALPASNPQGALSEASFLNTVYWGGLYDVVDEQGNALTSFGVQSDLGFDWVSSVPEPSHGVPQVVGITLLALRRCTGRSARRS